MSTTAQYLALPLVISNEAPINPNLLYIVETAQFCIVSFTFPFYIFVIYFLVEAQYRKMEELRTPFFKLCLSTAAVDLWTLSNNYIGAMFPKWGWGIPIYLYLDKYYAHTYLYFAWSTGVCQALSVCVLATNRLSAILFPSEHRTIWNSKRIRIAVIIQFLPGILLGLLTFLNNTQLYRNNTGGIVPKFTIVYLTNIYFTMAGVLLFLVSVYIIFSYCHLFYVLHKNSKLMRKSGFHRARMSVRKREFKLFTMSSIIVAIQLSVLCLLVVYTTSIFILSLEEFYLLFNALTDLNSGINPYLLWVFSDSLRKYILKRLGLGKKKKKNGKTLQSAASMVTVM